MSNPPWIRPLRELETCAGKIAWPTWADANTAARRSRRKHGLPSTPYHCEVCGRYHIGQPGRVARKRRPAPADLPE